MYNFLVLHNSYRTYTTEILKEISSKMFIEVYKKQIFSAAISADTRTQIEGLVRSMQSESNSLAYVLLKDYVTTGFYDLVHSDIYSKALGHMKHAVLTVEYFGSIHLYFTTLQMLTGGGRYSPTELQKLILFSSNSHSQAWLEKYRVDKWNTEKRPVVYYEGLDKSTGPTFLPEQLISVKSIKKLREELYPESLLSIRIDKFLSEFDETKMGNINNTTNDFFQELLYTGKFTTA